MIHDFSSFAFITLAQAAPAGADNAAQVTSIWDFVLKGGVMMIPIGLCSLVTIAVSADRAISLRKSAVIPLSFLPGLTKHMKESAGDRSSSLAYCKKHDSPIARVFAAGVKRLGLPLETLERHIAEAGERELFKLRKNMRALSIIAAIAPLMGLLGTIFGMIAAFQTVAVSGDALGRAELLASGIYEALITTAAGLIVALPALILYHWLNAKVDKLIHDMDLMTLDFIESHALPAARQPRSDVVYLDNGSAADVSNEVVAV